MEGLLAAFPKLIGHAKQHTFVETDSVRYVYQPLENQMFLLLITNKSSNIVEDLGTLRLLAKVVPDVAGSLHEHAINEHAFELIFAFDEVLTAGGYKEEATLSSIRTNLEMHSHEEDMHKMIKEQKEAEAKKHMQEKAKSLREAQLKAMKENFMTGQNGKSAAVPGAMAGFGGGGRPGGGDMFQGFGSDSVGAGGGAYDTYGAFQPSDLKASEPAEPVSSKKGMKLGAKGATAKKMDSMMAAMAIDDKLSLGTGKKNDFGFGLDSVSAPVAPPSTPLTIALEEKITVSMNREGGIENCEVKGTLTLTANTEVGTFASIGVNKSFLEANCSSGWTFGTHPKVNKPDYEKKGILTLKGGKGFPLSRPVGILRWSYSGEDAAPITINCWPEDEGSGSINVSIEMEMNRPDMTLTDVNILIPLGTSDPPAIESIDGQYKHDGRAGMLCWHFDTIDSSNSSGSLEFSIGGSNPDAFFPIQISFGSQSLLCPIEITSVASTSNGSSIPNSLTKSVVPDTYQVA